VRARRDILVGFLWLCAVAWIVLIVAVLFSR
jgi:hypothetical protein